MDMPHDSCGILVRGTTQAAAIFALLDVPLQIQVGANAVTCTLAADYAALIAPDGDTLELNTRLGFDSLQNERDLDREILLAMLLSPVTFEFPSEAELAAHLRIRKYVVQAARNTQLDFHTTEAERPVDYWTYHEDTGFTILPGKSLAEALRKATQPDDVRHLYSFSCYRASEYVILLGIVQELPQSNPELFMQLQQQWQTKSIQSGKFHDTFLREYGSMAQPLPPRYYVPGDRLWFRNPDAYSSDASGYEGSWVIYLGGGLFSNFWNRAQPYTLTGKCIEIYHWRNATYHDAAGELRVDEGKVAELVRQTLQHPAEVERILVRMLRMREPAGLYVNGGCIDTTREYPRWVCAGTSDIVLP